MNSYIDHKLSKKTKLSYLLFVIMAFLVGLIAAIAFFPNEAGTVASEYIFLLVSIIFLLSCIYAIQKLLFHSQAKSRNDELLLEELPYDEDDIKRSH